MKAYESYVLKCKVYIRLSHQTESSTFPWFLHLTHSPVQWRNPLFFSFIFSLQHSTLDVTLLTRSAQADGFTGYGM